MNILSAKLAGKIEEPGEVAGGNTIETSEGIATLKGFEDIFSNIITVAIELAGVAFFLMLLFGGFKYLTAGDDPKKAEGAKKTLTSALMGFVLLIMAYLIILLIEKVTGANVTDFQVTLP